MFKRAYFSTQNFSQKLSATCAKWQLLHRTQNFFSDMSQKVQSKLLTLIIALHCFYNFVSKFACIRLMWMGVDLMHCSITYKAVDSLFFPFILCFLLNISWQDSRGSKNVTVRFRRRTDVMPSAPEETKYHPSAVDLLLIKRLISETSKQNLLQFLQHDFTSISKSYAERLIGKVKHTNVLLS